ncbi:PqqD family protein [Nocardia abscessus]|uniref:PqqD family protein n=1 Tax=Nocardia abscessus TaxID=120957 RepID=UPI00189524F5|nr:PqqD family protein [Nocardia abscessus]MBF6339788.1 PqqD family protein [Nocardia abscessus]
MSTPALTSAAASTVTCNGDMWILVPEATSGEVLVVNDTGYQIFQHCDGTHSCSDIAYKLAKATDAPAEDVTHDVTVFVSRLRSAGLLAG